MCTCVFLRVCACVRVFSASGFQSLSVLLSEAAGICRDELHCWHKLLGPGLLPLHWASHPRLTLIDLILGRNEFPSLRAGGGGGGVSVCVCVWRRGWGRRWRWN